MSTQESPRTTTPTSDLERPVMAAAIRAVTPLTARWDEVMTRFISPRVMAYARRRVGRRPRLVAMSFTG
jgi:hypothetical protein